MPIPSGKLAARQAYVVANRWNWPTCTRGRITMRVTITIQMFADLVLD